MNKKEHQHDYVILQQVNISTFKQYSLRYRFARYRDFCLRRRFLEGLFFLLSGNKNKFLLLDSSIKNKELNKAPLFCIKFLVSRFDFLTKVLYIFLTATVPCRIVSYTSLHKFKA